MISVQGPHKPAPCLSRVWVVWVLPCALYSVAVAQDRTFLEQAATVQSVPTSDREDPLAGDVQVPPRVRARARLVRGDAISAAAGISEVRHDVGVQVEAGLTSVEHTFVFEHRGAHPSMITRRWTLPQGSDVAVTALVEAEICWDAPGPGPCTDCSLADVAQNTAGVGVAIACERLSETAPSPSVITDARGLRAFHRAAAEEQVLGERIAAPLDPRPLEATASEVDSRRADSEGQSQRPLASIAIETGAIEIRVAPVIPVAARHRTIGIRLRYSTAWPIEGGQYRYRLPAETRDRRLARRMVQFASDELSELTINGRPVDPGAQEVAAADDIVFEAQVPSSQTDLLVRYTTPQQPEQWVLSRLRQREPSRSLSLAFDVSRSTLGSRALWRTALQSLIDIAAAEGVTLHFYRFAERAEAIVGVPRASHLTGTPLGTRTRPQTLCDAFPLSEPRGSVLIFTDGFFERGAEALPCAGQVTIAVDPTQPSAGVSALQRLTPNRNVWMRRLGEERSSVAALLFPTIDRLSIEPEGQASSAIELVAGSWTFHTADRSATISTGVAREISPSTVPRNWARFSSQIQVLTSRLPAYSDAQLSCEPREGWLEPLRPGSIAMQSPNACPVPNTRTQVPVAPAIAAQGAPLPAAALISVLRRQRSRIGRCLRDVFQQSLLRTEVRLMIDLSANEGEINAVDVTSVPELHPPSGPLTSCVAAVVYDTDLPLFRGAGVIRWTVTSQPDQVVSVEDEASVRSQVEHILALLPP